MLATVPKHKGTEKLQADIKHRLSQERKEAHSKGAPHSVPFYLVEKEGAAQVALAGPPNSAQKEARMKLRDLIAATREFAGVTGRITLDEKRNAVKTGVFLGIKDRSYYFVGTVEP